jgi:hypothetical protein
MIGADRRRPGTSKERREDDKRAKYRQDDHEHAIRKSYKRRKDNERAEDEKDRLSFHQEECIKRRQ